MKKKMMALGLGIATALTMGLNTIGLAKEGWDGTTGWPSGTAVTVMPGQSIPKGDITLRVVEQSQPTYEGYEDVQIGVIRLKTPQNCGPWVYEDVIDEFMEAFGVTSLRQDLAFADYIDADGMVHWTDDFGVEHVSEEDPWDAVLQDPSVTYIELTNGIKKLHPGNNYRLRNGATMAEGASNIYDVIIPGDVNSDGQITLSDLTVMLDYVQSGAASMTSGTLTANPGLGALDLNGDGNATLADLVALVGVLQAGKNPLYTGPDIPSAGPLHMDTEPVYDSWTGCICMECGYDAHHDLMNGDDTHFSLDDHKVGGWESSLIVKQIGVKPAEAGGHERYEVTCNYCDLNLTRRLIDPEAHRQEHLAAGELHDIFMGNEFFRTEWVWVPAV